MANHRDNHNPKKHRQPHPYRRHYSRPNWQRNQQTNHRHFYERRSPNRGFDRSERGVRHWEYYSRSNSHTQDSPSCRAYDKTAERLRQESRDSYCLEKRRKYDDGYARSELYARNNDPSERNRKPTNSFENDAEEGEILPGQSPGSGHFSGEVFVEMPERTRVDRGKYDDGYARSELYARNKDPFERNRRPTNSFENGAEEGEILPGQSPGSGHFSGEVFVEMPERTRVESKAASAKSKERVMPRSDHVCNNNGQGDDKKGYTIVGVVDEERNTVVRRFRWTYDSLVDEEGKGKPSVRMDQKVWKVIKNSDMLPEYSKTVGPVHGVEVEAVFHRRLELVATGLHLQPTCGIDYMTSTDSNRTIVTSLVATEGYSDCVRTDALTYIGEGGKFNNSKGVYVKDQELTGGNLALKNSIMEGNYIRVIRGIKPSQEYVSANPGTSKRRIFVYDGLYKVIKCKEDVGEHGETLYKFTLNRCSGQPTIDWEKYKCK